jgi:hypothetical protein
MYPDCCWFTKKHSRELIFLYRKYLWICNNKSQLFECFQFILVSNYKNFGSLKKVTFFLVVASSLLLFLQRSFSLKDSGFHKGWFLVFLYFSKCRLSKTIWNRPYKCFDYWSKENILSYICSVENLFRFPFDISKKFAIEK